MSKVAKTKPVIQLAPLLLSTGQAAKALGVGKTKMLELIRSKRIDVVMLDDRIRVPLANIEAFAAGLQQGYVVGRKVA